MMIRHCLLISFCAGALVLGFSGPVFAQNLFLNEQEAQERESAKKQKEGSFFSRLFSGKKKQAAKPELPKFDPTTKAENLDPDLLDPSGRAPQNAEEYLARSNALNAPLAEAFAYEQALAAQRVAKAQEIYKQQTAQMEAALEARRAKNAAAIAAQPPLTAPAAAPPPEVKNNTSTTIRSKTPVFQSGDDGQNSGSSGGVFKKY